MFSWFRIEPSTSDKEGEMLVVDKRRGGGRREERVRGLAG